jgi:hypothetical protein
VVGYEGHFVRIAWLPGECTATKDTYQQENRSKQARTLHAACWVQMPRCDRTIAFLNTDQEQKNVKLMQKV